MADSWILNCQYWLDGQYEGTPGYLPTPQDGRTGWPTMYSLTRALQLALGISATSNAFGPTTMTRFQTQIGTIGSSTAASHPNVIGILRSALWCKGYPGGYTAEPGLPAFLQWDSNLAASIAQVRTDLGLSSTGGVDAKLMKSLLAMDAYVTVPGGSSQVRTIQQWLNGRYAARRDFSLIPCDGVYSRQVQTGLLFGLQFEIGMADGAANGNFGPGTQQGVRTHGGLVVGSADGTRRMVSIFQAALILNGQTATPFSGTFTTATRSEMQSFQSFASLPTTTGANYTTWASLLVSTGDPDRPVAAADTSSLVLPARANSLVSNGHSTIGRYINGTGAKRLAHSEPGVYANAGLRWFPIYQEWNNEPKWFSPAQGRVQGLRIAARAAAFGIPSGSTIFLAVDYDPTDDEITSIVIPHFRAAREALQSAPALPIKLGVYGTRNVCRRLSAAGITEGSFVADMSSGWSGNLGFRLPADWQYDQIKTVTIGTGDGAIEIDRVASSSRATSLSATALTRTPRKHANQTGVATGYDEDVWWRWAQLATLAEAAPEGATVGADGAIVPLQRPSRQEQSWFVLYEAYRHHYGTSAIEDPTSAFNIAFDAIFAPPPGPDTRYAAFRASYDQLYTFPSNGVFGWAQAAGIALGDIPHGAVVAASLRTLGVPGPSAAQAAIPEYASWAGDLMGVWRNYEIERIARGGVLDAYPWLRMRIGTTLGLDDGTNGFSIEDLRADAFGHIVAHETRTTDARIDEVVRTIQLGIADDPGFLAKRFASLRFGGRRSSMVAAASDAVSSFFARNEPIDRLFRGVRKPGAAEGNANDPSAAVRATEVDACGRAFADALIAAQSEWTARS